MENKNMPENELDNVIPTDEEVTGDTLFDEDIYLPGDAEEELTDDELDISELLKKYLPDFSSYEGTEGQEETEVIADEEAVADPEETVFMEVPAEVEPTVDLADAAGEVASEEVFDEQYDEQYDEIVEETDAEYEGEDYSEYEYVSDDAPYEEETYAEPPKIESAEELEIPEDVDLDETDINLMVAFGLDDELAATMGAEVAAKLTEELDAEAKEQEEKVRRSVENEYIDPSQTAEIAMGLKKRYVRLKEKIIFAAIIGFVLLIYENLRVVGIPFTDTLAEVYPVVYTMISLQLMLFCAALGYEQLLGGCADIFRGKFGPSSIAFLGNVAAIVYSIVLADTSDVQSAPILFNACAASLTIAALVRDFLVAKRNILSFNVISAKRPKYVVRYMSAADAGIPGGLFEDDDVSEGGVLRIEKTRFVDDFFARISEGAKSGKGYAVAYVCISLIIAALVGVYTAFVGPEGGVGPVNAAFVSFFATVPLSLFIAMGYPFYKGVSGAYDLDGTILGEGAAEEYSEAGAVCFDDIDAFPSYGVKVQNIKIYNNHRVDRVLYYAASAFKVAGGPLSDVFEVATMEIGTSDNVELKAAAEGYLGVSVDEKNIIFGRADALREYGINLPDSVTDEDESLPFEVCPMYMIREGKLMAKLLIRYMLDSDFEFLLNDLSDEGMCACIKTFDPNIDDDLITSRLGGGRFPFRVLRYNDTDEINRISDRASSGIVSRGTTKPLLGIIGSCSKILGMRKAGFAIGIVSAIVAAFIVWLLVAANGFTTLSSAVVIIYQILWSIPVIITTKMFLK